MSFIRQSLSSEAGKRLPLARCVSEKFGISLSTASRLRGCSICNVSWMAPAVFAGQDFSCRAASQVFSCRAASQVFRELDKASWLLHRLERRAWRVKVFNVCLLRRVLVSRPGAGFGHGRDCNACRRICGRVVAGKLRSRAGGRGL